MAQTLFGTFCWKIGAGNFFKCNTIATAALDEHEGFIRPFLSKKRNTIDDLAAVLQTTYLEQRDLSIKRF